VRWYIKPSFDGIFTQQYLYQKLLESEIIVGGWVVSLFWDSVHYIWYLSSINFSLTASTVEIADYQKKYVICEKHDLVTCTDGSYYNRSSHKCL